MLGSDAGRRGLGCALPRPCERCGQRKRAVGGQDPRSGYRRRGRSWSAARQGKPHRRQEDVRAFLSLHLPERGRPGAVRDSLRGGLHPARNHRRGDRWRPRAGRDHCAGGRLHLHGGQRILREAALSRGCRVVVLRHPPAVRRSGAQRQRGHPRLRASSRSGAGAHALGVRRQDHDLSQARRAGRRHAGGTAGL